MSLSAEELERYREDGYLIFPALIRGRKLARYKATGDDLVERARSLTGQEGGFHLQPDEGEQPIPGRLFKVQGVCVEEPRLLELAREPAILNRVEALVGPNIDVFGTKFFPMLPRGGTSTGWHQDNHYFGTNSDRIVSCGIYLEDSDAGNGCLRLIPKSHRTGQLARHEHGGGTYAHGDWVDVDESRGIDVVCPGGTLVLFSANLLHGASPNRSERSRYSTAWHYIPGDLKLERFPRGIYKDRHIVRGR